MTIYRVTTECGEEFLMKADMVQASAQISVCYNHDSEYDEPQWDGTPLQTADARHNIFVAAELVNKYESGEDDFSPVESVEELNNEPDHEEAA